MRTATVSLALLLLTSTLFAAALERSYSFDPAQVSVENGYAIIEMPESPSLGDAGEPLLPMKGYSLLLPPGESLVDVQVISERWLPMAGIYVPKPASQMQRISEAVPMMTQPDPAIYEGESVFPAVTVSNIRTHFLRGHSIGAFVIRPVRWNPVSETLEYLADVTVHAITQPSQKGQNALELLRRDEATHTLLESVTSDLESETAYPTIENNLDELDEPNPSILIICPANHEFVWEEYADWKYSRGQVATILTTENIYATYEGRDNAEKVRNAIIDQYQTYLIEHVILGGDVDYVPYRGFYNQAYQGGEVDDNIPADLYFAGLDGTWNENNNSRWGENASEDDLLQEVTVGRCPANSINDVMTWTAKMISYQDEPVTGEVLEALMVGEDLGWEAWGGDYKDQVGQGSTANGYTTTGFPDQFNVETLYDRDSEWSVPQLFSQLNSGVHYVNHLGHANVTYALKASNSNINNNELTNDGETHSYYLLYTQGCYCGAFEQACITEKWNAIDHGAFAVISNSRYGWGDGGGTNGASQRFDRQFFDAIFGEDKYIVGDVNRDSKHDNISYIDISCMRWCYYEINLFGDPSIELYTDEVSELEVELPDVYVIGSPYLEIATSQPWARVTIFIGDEIVFSGMTDGIGNANIPLELVQAEALGISIIAKNHLPWYGSVPVIASEGPYPLVTEVSIADEAGNDDGVADFGENITMEVELTNMGQDVLNSANVYFSTNSEHLLLSETQIVVDGLQPNQTVTVEQPAYVDVNVEDGTDVLVYATVEAEDETWEREFSLTLHAPRLSMAVRRVDDMDTGNGNCRIDAGETATVVMEFRNDGSASLENVTLVAASDNPYVLSVESDENEFDVLADNETIFTQDFIVTMSEDTPEFYRAVFMLGVQREDGYEVRNLQRLDIGGFYDCADGALQNVSHYAVSGWNDQWHLSMERNDTPDGNFSWKAGSSNAGSDYGDNLNAVLQLPALPRVSAMTLNFTHWIEAEISAQHGGECYDGGLVEISADGEMWMQVTMPGYNYTARGSGPFEEGTRLYSGNVEWERQTYNIPYGASDSLYIRFRFGSDQDDQNQDVYEGWYLDDISVTLGDELDTPLELQALVEYPGIVRLTWATPAPEVDECANLEGFIVYRDQEAISDVIVDVDFGDDVQTTPYGLYVYQVSALYETGESSPTPAIEVNWDGSFDDVSETEETIPVTWELSTPYPNPFNPTTTVRVSLPQAANVQLTVFDVLGREVTRLVDGHLGMGYHSFTVDANNWASGMYFVTLEAPGATFTRKMVLVR